MINKKKIFLIIFLIIISFSWIIYFFNKDFFELKNLFLYLETIQNYISYNFFLSVIIFTFSYFFLVACNFPMASLLSMVGGFLFGTWVGGISVVIGGTIGAFTIFIIAKFFFYDYVNRIILKKYSFISKYFKKNDVELMFLIRLIPLTPFFIQNIILAGLGAKNIKFFFTTLIGLLPGSFIFSSVGQGLEEIFISGEEIGIGMIAKLEYIVPIVILILLILFILFFKKRLQ